MADVSYLSLILEYPENSMTVSHLAVRCAEPIEGLEMIEIGGWDFWGFKLFDPPRKIKIREIRNYVTAEMIIKLRQHGEISVIGRWSK